MDWFNDDERGLTRHFSILPEICKKCDKLFFWGWRFRNFMPAMHMRGYSEVPQDYICGKCFPNKELARAYIKDWVKRVHIAMGKFLNKKGINF